uniref:Uncharacterized protein n=1 Tax=Paenibacillus polymyxa TaxID=1406 RepID=A0AAE9TKE1_PAEPO
MQRSLGALHEAAKQCQVPYATVARSKEGMALWAERGDTYTCWAMTGIRLFGRTNRNGMTMEMRVD